VTSLRCHAREGGHPVNAGVNRSRGIAAYWIVPFAFADDDQKPVHGIAATKKKTAWFPRRPFLSYGSHTLAGDFRTSAPGAYLPAVSYSVAAARRDSRELEPDTDAMVSHLRKMSPLSRDNADGARRRRRMSPLIPLFTGVMAVVEGACNRHAIADARQ
jgi:hypothetical protein